MNHTPPSGSPEAPFQPTAIAEGGSLVSSDLVLEENNIRISFFPSRRKKVKKINLVIEGDFSIYNVQLVKDVCQKLLQYYEMLHIALKNLNAIDLAAIQLLQVLQRSTASWPHPVQLESELSREDKALIGSAGLLEVMSTHRHN